MPFTDGVFSRIWQFVDRFQTRDHITRTDMDVSHDDLAGGIQQISTDLTDHEIEAIISLANMFTVNTRVLTRQMSDVITSSGSSGSGLFQVVAPLVGPRGWSSYEIWVQLGNVGTEEEFLDVLSGSAVSATAANVTAAVAAQALAEKWASEAEDTLVADGKYSAFHHAVKAAASALAASTDAADANTAKVAAEAAKAAMDLVFDNFDDRFLGTFTTALEPTTDNDGDPILVGAIYYNSDDQELKFWNSASWDSPEAAAAASATAAANSAASALSHKNDAESAKTASETAQAAAEAAQVAAEAAEAGAAAAGGAELWVHGMATVVNVTTVVSPSNQQTYRAKTTLANSTVDPISDSTNWQIISLGTLANLGVTASASEINKLDGMTASQADLNKTTGVEANADVTDAANVGSSIHGATAKTTPVDADTLPLIDSAAANVLKKLSWANIKATLKTYFDTLYASLSGAVFTGDVQFDSAITTPEYPLTGTTPTLDPANGTLQKWTLTGNSTPVDGLADGDFIKIKVDDGAAYSITWPTITWKEGSAPALEATGWTHGIIWKEGTTLYGALVGAF